MEQIRLNERREGLLRRALGMPLPSESVEELDRLGEEDRTRAEQGLVPLMGEDGEIIYKHIDDLRRSDVRARIAAERQEIEWLASRIARFERWVRFPTS